MSSTAFHKNQRDRARFSTALKRDPDLIAKALKIIFGFKRQESKGAKSGQHAAGDRLLKVYKKKHFDSSILQYLVGEGYVRPEGGCYVLSGKGVLCINDSLPLPALMLEAKHTD